MAPITKTLALAGALFALTGIAAPVEKRAVVWETVTDVVWTTVDVTTTIYPNQGEPTPVATVVAVTTPAAAVETTSSAAPVEEEEAKAAPTTSTTEAPAPVAQPTEKATVQAQKAAAAPSVVESSSESSSSSTTTTAAAAVQTAQRSTDTSSSSGSSTSSSTGAMHSGQATYYDTATLASNPSSCGTTNDGETEAVLALPVGIMTDSDCGKTVTIKYGGRTATGKVVDKCMGCDDGSIDLSRALFEEIADLSAGRISDVYWSIN